MDFIPFTIVDFIDIVLVASFVYGLYRMTRGTNAPYILTGIVVIYVLWVVVKALNMELLQAILGQVINVGVIAIIILFQPELRHFLQMIGRRQGGFNFINRKKSYSTKPTRKAKSTRKWATSAGFNIGYSAI